MTGQNDYGYTTGAPSVVRNLAISYNSTLCSSKNICDHPSSVQVNDGSSHQYALTNYSNYDGNGNIKQIDRWTSGSNYLSSYYNYNGNGTLSTAQDPNGAVTHYTYSSSVCNSAFPTSVYVPGDAGGNLTTGYAYNCGGGVVTSVTDPNGAVTTIHYDDPYFWRPRYVLDPVGYQTAYNYYGVNNTGSSPIVYVGQVESVLNFSSNATVDLLSTPDSFGRHFLDQQREAPGSANWDSTQTGFYGNGSVAWHLLPYVSTTPGQGTTTELPGTTYTYDGLGRYVDISDWTGFDTHFSYSQNDVTVSTSPAPAQSRQYEYDAVGNLTSVCEITGATSAGCGQNNGTGIGYKTTYMYDPLGDLTNVAQDTNQSTSQPRTFHYDGRKRMTQESNPESGTDYYTYDSDSTCSASSAGDMVKKIDAAGNLTCFYYDGLHRLTDAGRSGPVCRRYRYDQQTVNGVQMPNAAGRLAEIMTDNCGGTQ